MFGDNPEQESCPGFTADARKIRKKGPTAYTFWDWLKQLGMVAVGGFEPPTKGL
jgi:hypothetical protein